MGCFTVSFKFRFAELCKSHYEARERKRAEEALAQENAQQYFQQQAPISYVQQQPAQPYEDDVYMNMPPYYQSQNLIMGPTNPVVAGDFYENECKFFSQMKTDASSESCIWRL